MELRAGEAERRKFCAQWKVAFLLFLPKPSFRKIALCSLFLVMLFCSVSCISPLSGAAKLSRVPFQPRWCSVVRGGRAETPRGLPPTQLSLARQHQHRPFPGRTKALHLPPISHTVQQFIFQHFRSWQAQGYHGTFSGGDTGVSWGCRWVRGSVSGQVVGGTKWQRFFGSGSQDV